MKSKNPYKFISINSSRYITSGLKPLVTTLLAGSEYRSRAKATPVRAVVRPALVMLLTTT